MSPLPRQPSKIEGAALLDVRLDAVACQLDDLNALAEALATASNEDDAERLVALGDSLDRYAVALSWNVEAVLPVIAAYAERHAGIPDELFAPAFVLKAIAPDSRELAALAPKLSPDVTALLERFLLSSG